MAFPLSFRPALRFRFPRFPVAVEFTREGLVFVLLCLAIGAAAVNTGNNVLYFIFSIMLGMIVVSGMVSRRMLQGLEPVIQFPDHFFSGVANVCYVSVLNRKKRLPSIAIRFVVRDHAFTSISRNFFFINPGEQASGFTKVFFSRRGIFRLAELELQTQFPFSFFLKIRRYVTDQTVRVYPKIYRFSEDVFSRFAHGVLTESPYRGDSQQLLHLRDYSHLDSSNRIHWKASAKADKLMVKEFQKEQGRDLYLYFDCFPKSLPDETAERAISFLASLAFLFSERDITARIVLADHAFTISDTILPLLQHLADWSPVLPSTLKSETPQSTDALVLVLQSRKVSPRLDSVSPSARSIYLEDWAQLMIEDGALHL